MACLHPGHPIAGSRQRANTDRSSYHYHGEQLNHGNHMRVPGGNIPQDAHQVQPREISGSGAGSDGPLSAHRVWPILQQA